jgi:hypothetical protein
MTLEDEMPPWMERHLAPYAARSAHKFCAARIRKKLVNESAAETLLTEAFDMVRKEIGPFPSEANHLVEVFLEAEVDPTEIQMREIALRNYESLSETESYMWGLGIAGVFHQWERDTRAVIMALSVEPPNPAKLERLKFTGLCKEVEKTGFAITTHGSYATLRLAGLVANTIKHGNGRSFRELVVERPNFFQGGPVGVRMGNLPPQPHHLRVFERHFDEISAAIEALVHGYADAVS